MISNNKARQGLDTGRLDDGYEPIRHYAPDADPATARAVYEAERELSEIVEPVERGPGVWRWLVWAIGAGLLGALWWLV